MRSNTKMGMTIGFIGAGVMGKSMAGHLLAAGLPLRMHGGGTMIATIDAGKGFDVEKMWHVRKSRHLGVLGMHERIERVGGAFMVASGNRGRHDGQGANPMTRTPKKESSPMKAEKLITVVLAEDHQIVREGLKVLLQAEADIEVIGEASAGDEVVTMARTLRPDVIVMDIAMPRLNGLEATRQIRMADPDAKILILSAHSDDVYVERVTELGASGYLVKQTASCFLSEAIRAIRQGGTFYSPAVSSRYKKQHRQTRDRKGALKEKNTTLSPREMEVLQQIAEGGANKQIAAELDISVKTVEKHRDHLMQKLDIHDTAGLTRYAISAGIIESSVQVTIV